MILSDGIKGNLWLANTRSNYSQENRRSFINL